ncbi:hypothetical protein ACLOJK_000873 [Asimina triloba]
MPGEGSRHPMAGAAGGFVTRSFESMLKECSGKKYGTLQKAIQTYFGRTTIFPYYCQNFLHSMKETNQQSVPNEKTEVVAVPEDESSVENSNGADNMNKAAGGSIAASLASAGHTVEGSEAELVLQPLRLAFETKNLKLVEPALDCLHNEGTVTYYGTQLLLHGEPLLGVIRICYNIALNSKSPINQATSKAMLTQMISIVFRRMESDQGVQSYTVSPNSPVQTDMTSEENLNTNDGEIFLDDSEEKKITLGDALSLNRGKESSLASVEELQNLAGGADIKGLEAVLDKAVNLEDGKNISRGLDLESMSIGQRDALLLFRTLCKMGMKEENDDVTTKTRLLSLELLQGLLEGVSHSFTKNFHFIDSVKAYLSYALLRASVSSSLAVFQFATGIFTVLLLRFRESLKALIGNQGMLEKVCKDTQMLVDIFVNYDCDLEAPNLFERMVNALSRIAQGTLSTDPNSTTQSQIASIKGSSLQVTYLSLSSRNCCFHFMRFQCLVSVLKSLADWEKFWRQSGKPSSSSQSMEVKVSERESIPTDESKSKEDTPNQFEKAKAHKSTMEAAISEMSDNVG